METSNLPSSVDQERSRAFEALMPGAIEVAALDVEKRDGTAYPVGLFAIRDQPRPDRVSPGREREPVNPAPKRTSSDGIQRRPRVGAVQDGQRLPIACT